MLATPEIIQTNAQAAAVIRLTILRSEMMKAFGPAVGDLMTTLAAQGVEPVGAVFAHHLKMTPDTFDCELGVKVAAHRASYLQQRSRAWFTAVRMKASRPPGPNSTSG